MWLPCLAGIGALLEVLGEVADDCSKVVQDAITGGVAGLAVTGQAGRCMQQPPSLRSGAAARHRQMRRCQVGMHAAARIPKGSRAAMSCQRGDAAGLSAAAAAAHPPGCAVVHGVTVHGPRLPAGKVTSTSTAVRHQAAAALAALALAKPAAASKVRHPFRTATARHGTGIWRGLVARPSYPMPRAPSGSARSMTPCSCSAASSVPRRWRSCPSHGCLTSPPPPHPPHRPHRPHHPPPCTAPAAAQQRAQ
jgi:hypothetical protein